MILYLFIVMMSIGNLLRICSKTVLSYTETAYLEENI